MCALAFYVNAFAFCIFVCHYRSRVTAERTQDFIPHTTLKYEIDESGLWSIRAIFTNEYSDDKQYIAEYNTIKENFTKEWGKPEVISEDESRFSFKCFWNNNPLVLSKTDDGKIMFQFTAWSPAFYEQITSSSAP